MPDGTDSLERELTWLRREYRYKTALINHLEQSLSGKPPVSEPDFGPHDWFDFQPVYDRAVAEAPVRATLVEVGCWLGRSLVYLARRAKESGKALSVIGVDPGFGSTGMCDEALHAPVLAELGGNTTTRLLCNLRAAGVLDVVTVIAAPSREAARLFPERSVAFVFIDGAHDAESVKTDIWAWMGKVTPGGRLAGHDYDQHWPSVVKTVDALFGRPVPDDLCPNCWSWRKQ